MNDMEKNQIPETSEDFAAMLEETFVKFRPGQIVKGVVAQVSDDGIVVSIPGKADGNWRWRMLPGAASEELAQKLRRCAFRYVR